jgi:HK97 family phage portal protein
MNTYRRKAAATGAAVQVGGRDLFQQGYSAITNFTNEYEQVRAYIGWVYGAVNLIAQEVKTVDYRLYVNRTSTKNASIHHRLIQTPLQTRQLMAKKVKRQVVDKGLLVEKEMPALEELDNHVLLDLLANPNPFQTGEDLIEITEQHKKLAGNAFWLIIRDGSGLPQTIWPAMPWEVKIIPHPVEFIAGYEYQTPGGERIPFAPEDVIHFKSGHPYNRYRGMGVVAAAARAIDTDTHAQESNRRLFSQGGIPDLVLTAEEPLDDQSFRRLKQEWESSYAGSQNAHKTAILEGGVKPEKLNISPRELEFLEGRRFNRDEILAMFNLAADNLGITENSNRAVAEAQDYRLAKRVTRPEMKSITSTITQRLAPQYDIKLIVGFTDPVPEDKEFVLKEKTESVNKYRTINEIRALEGDEPITGGDEIYQPVGMVPLSVSADFVAATDKVANQSGQEEGDPNADVAATDNNKGLKKKAYTPRRKRVTKLANG